MKTYYNQTTNEWYYEGRSITKATDDGFFSGYPTEEMLLAWGFTEYVKPEPTAEEILNTVKQQKIGRLIAYDASTNINSFSLFGQNMWITPSERSNYMLTLEGAKRLGIENITFLGNNVSVDAALNMLDAINVYAMQCVGVTDYHKNTINSLTSIQEVEDYDYTVGYPEKLIFS